MGPIELFHFLPSDGVVANHSKMMSLFLAYALFLAICIHWDGMDIDKD
jgi:hypothetical protein